MKWIELKLDYFVAVGWIGSHANQREDLRLQWVAHWLTKCEWTIINLICVTFDISDRGEHKWHVSHADISISPTLRIKRHAFFTSFFFSSDCEWNDSILLCKIWRDSSLCSVWFPINFVFGLRPNRNKSISINLLAAAFLLLATSQHTAQNNWNRFTAGEESIQIENKQTATVCFSVCVRFVHHVPFC